MGPDTRPVADHSRPRREGHRHLDAPPGRRHGILRAVVQRPPAGTIPDTPGSYQFKDADGRVIYVGKAKSLRQRLSNYFQTEPPAAHRPDGGHRRDRRVDPGPQRRRGADARVQPHQAAPAPVQRPAGRRQELPVPRGHRVGRVAPRRWSCGAPSSKGVRYFGPYGHAYAIRETLDLLLRTFPMRSCSDNKFERHEKLGRPCLLFHIEKCSGPCVGEITRERYDELRRRAARVPRRRHRHRREAARSPRCGPPPTSSSSSGRPACGTGSPAVRRAIEKQQMVADRNEDLDVIGIADDELEAAVQVFYVRRGRVVGRKGFVARQGRGPHRARARSARVLEGLYDEPPRSACRSRCSSRRSPTTLDLYEEWLSELRGSQRRRSASRSGATSGRCSETVTSNASEEFTRHRLRRAADHNSRARALNELQDVARPARGAAAHRVLRHEPPPGHRLRRLDGGDGGRAAEEVASTAGSRSGGGRATTTSRRWRRCSPGGSPNYLERPRRSRSSERGRFAYPPQLLLVDGGKGQLGVAVRVLEELGLEDEIPVALAGQAVRGGVRPGPGGRRSASHASPRRCTCCSGSATSPTASPSRSTASCAASA